MKTLSKNAARRGAFTLAEVMIALGIVASVMIGMVAMIPHATRTIKESNSQTIMGRIANEIISNIQMSEWDRIDQDYKEKSFSYDGEGLAFQEKEGEKRKVIYQAKVELPVDPVSLSKGFEYRPDHIRKIKVSVEYRFGGQSSRTEGARERNTRHYTFYVANQNELEAKNN